MGGLSIIRALGRAGVPVACVVTSETKDQPSLSRYVRRTLKAPSAAANPDGLVAELLRFSSSISTPSTRPVLYVDNDDDLLFLSRNRDHLARHYRFALPSAELLEDLVDKRRFAALAARENLPTPETHVIAQGTATRDPRVQSWSHYPCIVKPGLRNHWFGSRFAHHVIAGTQKAICLKSHAELQAIATALESHPSDFILQPLIEGGEDHMVSYHAFVSNGVVIADFTGRKVRTAPREYGFSTYVQITDDERVRDIGREVVARLGFHGVIKLDFKEDERDGRLYLLEANPRFNLWHHPGAIAGVNLPALVYADLVSPGSARPEARPLRPGVRWMWALADLQAYRATGELDALRWLREFAGAHVVEDLCWSDPLPNVARLVGRLRPRVTKSGATAAQASVVAQG
jgi:predicted ATP-grasp superfamily ATP-dependent carboligase